MSPPVILSNGAGVQSTTVAIMALRGEIPLPDIALFADPGWEHASTMRTLRWIERRLTRAGVRCVRCTAGDLREDIKRERRGCSMPVTAITPDGRKLRLRRLCTRLYKLHPIEQYVRGTVLGLRPRQVAPIGGVRQLIGISIDERKRAERMRLVRWRTVGYPLLDAGMSRSDCVEYLARYGPPWEVTRSSCIGCPYTRLDEWREMATANPEEFAQAVEFDEAIRHKGTAKLDCECYLHYSGKPLAELV